jgi:hypothetical protein
MSVTEISTWLYNIRPNPRQWVQHSPSRRIWDHLRPRSSRNLSNLFVASDLVNMSAIMSEVGQYFRVMWPEETVWRIKWKWTSMCLVRPWKVESDESWIAPWLSQNKVVGIEKEKTQASSVRNLWIQRMSFEACVSATYSVSVLDKVTIGYFLQLQETIPVPIK